MSLEKILVKLAEEFSAKEKRKIKNVSKAGGTGYTLGSSAQKQTPAPAPTSSAARLDAASRAPAPSSSAFQIKKGRGYSALAKQLSDKYKKKITSSQLRKRMGGQMLHAGKDYKFNAGDFGGSGGSLAGAGGLAGKRLKRSISSGAAFRGRKATPKAAGPKPTPMYNAYSSKMKADRTANPTSWGMGAPIPGTGAPAPKAGSLRKSTVDHAALRQRVARYEKQQMATRKPLGTFHKNPVMRRLAAVPPTPGQ